MFASIPERNTECISEVYATGERYLAELESLLVGQYRDLVVLGSVHIDEVFFFPPFIHCFQRFEMLGPSGTEWARVYLLISLLSLAKI